ncbi:MAG: hypothetical protein AB1505_13955 [Candidatus Latescibacterota bacterium]
MGRIADDAPLGQGGAATPVDVGTEKQLVLDDGLTQSAAGVVLTMNPPDKTGEHNLVAEHPWEGGLIGGFTVVQDGDRYLAWYSAWPPGPEGRPGSDLLTRLCHAVSDDGIHFTKPRLGLFEYQGSRANNIVFAGAGHGYHAGTVFVDPSAPPEERFKLVDLRDARGRALKGFAAAAGDHLCGDSVAQTVAWQGRTDVSALRGRPVSLRFRMRQAKLFALQFAA